MKLWGGRFTETTDEFTDHFHSSISFDKRLYRQDITGSIAHCKMLVKMGIIPAGDGEATIEELIKILSDIQEGKITFDEKAEDIHMNVESLLISRLGEAGKRLHTGRSRNDQVALDIRMYMKDEIKTIQSLLLDLIQVLTRIAEENTETLMPGYTHLQRAQPITFAHHILAYGEMLKRDYERLADAYKRTDVMPLGSGALAGTTYPIDREFVAKELGFGSVTANSLDGVSDRDFLIEFLSAASLIMMHLSRFCEEIVLWSSHEFKFIELSDAYATGSSIMPQKKNPDMAELIRGKTGRVYGDLMSLLTVMKGLPLAYNKDMQEDKEAVFDGADTLKMVLPVLTGMLSTMKLLPENMKNAAKGGFANATDGADWLVKQGVAFRDAHEIMGKLVLYCIDEGKALEDLTMEELTAAFSGFHEDFYRAVALESCVNARKTQGGPAPEAVREQIKNNLLFLRREKNGSE